MKLFTLIHIISILAFCKCHSECLHIESKKFGFISYEKFLHKIFEVNRHYLTFLKKSISFDYDQYNTKCSVVNEFSNLIADQITVLDVCSQSSQLEKIVLEQVEFSQRFCVFTDKERQGVYE